MRAAIVTTVVLVAALAAPSAAWADTPPPDQDRNGWFSPTLSNSPVQIVLCTVPGACVIKGR